MPGLPLLDLLQSAIPAAPASRLQGLLHDHLGLIAGVSLAAGAGLGAIAALGIRQALDAGAKGEGRPRWPRDWPKDRELFISHTAPTKRQGYWFAKPEQVIGTGAMPIGRTYPRFSIFPDRYPFKPLRRMVEYACTKAVWVPPHKRLQHVGILGATGKGKSSAFIVPILVYDALHANSATFAIDVKSPAFVRMLGPLYRNAGKDVFFVDPWSEDGLAVEMVWRADEKRKNKLAEVIATYSSTIGGGGGGGGNEEFFREAATRLIRSLIELAQFWPRQHCNFPCIQQLIGAGGEALKEAFEKAADLLPGYEDEIVPAARAALTASADELRPAGRTPEMDQALRVLNRVGFRMTYAIRTMRKVNRDAAAGRMTAAQRDEQEAKFWSQLHHEWFERKRALDRLLVSMGEFIQGAPDTRNSIVSTLTNKTNWFADRNIAKAFSRDEVDVNVITDRPCLFLVGAPLAEKKTGSLFVSALLTNLALDAVYKRGMAIERDDPKATKHSVWYVLDEFPQLNVTQGPDVLATFRGYLGGLTMVYQERAQMRTLYKDDQTTMEGNMVHKFMFTGSHEDTARFYVENTIGKVAIRKKSKSGVQGKEQTVSESVEQVSLMEPNELREGSLNGRQMPEIGFSVGGETKAFPFRPVQFFEDPTVRKLLGMKPKLVKKDKAGKKTRKFWEWEERWSLPEQGKAYLVRRRPLSPLERQAGTPDPVYERRMDPYTQYLDYFLAEEERKVYDELEAPVLELSEINVVDNDPRAAAAAGRGAPMMPSAPPAGALPPGTAPRPPQAMPAGVLIPVYGSDFRTLINDDFAPTEAIAAVPPLGGTLQERLTVDPLADGLGELGE